MKTMIEHEMYVPGYRWPKVLFTLYGVTLFALALPELIDDFRLLLFGTAGEAIASHVIKSKPGAPDMVLSTDLELDKNLEVSDRRSLFWNVFRLTTSQGTEIEIRLPTPGLLKPLYPLSDENGMPTAIRVAYDPNQPNRVLFPTVFSSWVFPSLLALIGVITFCCGVVLLIYANRPIEMPILHSPGDEVVPHSPE